MKSLTLIRHAKSSWKDRSCADADRPLSARGKKAIVHMAPQVRLLCAESQQVYVSPAKRCRKTLQGLIQAGALSAHSIEFDKTLYTFNMNDLLTFLLQLDDALESVVLIGHNPALENLSFWLTGERIDKFPTLACAQIQLTQNAWSEITPGKGRLMAFLTPANTGMHKNQ